MITIKEINENIQGQVLGGAKIPHGVSNPVIHKEDDKYYIAYFVYTFEKKNLDTGDFQRPLYWVIADVKTGDLVAEYNCREKDFSEQGFDKLYSMNDPSVRRPDDKYYKVMDSLFDTVRASIAFGSSMDSASYKAYFSNLLAITPSEYKVFYRELSV
ncbi:MAG: hypothetical protein K5871_03490 [Lachnospiraceae bacterium]|nr:hypothetical protein [Lachnospiraceae bacterium]